MILLFFVQTYQEKKKLHIIEMSRDSDRIGKKSPYMEISRDNEQKGCVYK